MGKPQEPSPRLRMAADRIGAYTTAAMALATLTMLVGAVHLGAWLLGVMTDRGLSTITMKANTALCLLLAGAALLVFVRRPLGPLRCWIGRAFAIVVLTVGVLTFCENAVGCDLGIDQLLGQEAR